MNSAAAAETVSLVLQELKLTNCAKDVTAYPQIAVRSAAYFRNAGKNDAD